MISDVVELTAVLEEIQRNQEEYEQINRSRFLSPWKLRRQYRLTKLNEPLFARIGVHHPSMRIDTDSSLFARWLRGSPNRRRHG